MQIIRRPCVLSNVVLGIAVGIQATQAARPVGLAEPISADWAPDAAFIKQSSYGEVFRDPVHRAAKVRPDQPEEHGLQTKDYMAEVKPITDDRSNAISGERKSSLEVEDTTKKVEPITDDRSNAISGETKSSLQVEHATKKAKSVTDDHSKSQSALQSEGSVKKEAHKSAVGDDAHASGELINNLQNEKEVAHKSAVGDDAHALGGYLNNLQNEEQVGVTDPVKVISREIAIMGRVSAWLAEIEQAMRKLISPITKAKNVIDPPKVGSEPPEEKQTITIMTTCKKLTLDVKSYTKKLETLLPTISSAGAKIKAISHDIQHEEAKVAGNPLEKITGDALVQEMEAANTNLGAYATDSIKEGESLGAASQEFTKTEQQLADLQREEKTLVLTRIKELQHTVAGMPKAFQEILNTIGQEEEETTEAKEEESKPDEPKDAGSDNQKE